MKEPRTVLHTGVPARDNPFRSERIESLRYRGASVPEILERWESFGRCGALVGPKGTGKTTLLAALSNHLRTKGSRVFAIALRASDRRVGLSDLGTRVRTGVDGVVLVIDGAEQLGPLRWHALRRRARRAAGWLITTHAPGRFPSLHEHRTSADTALALVDELAPGSASDARATAHVRDLHARCGGDVRELFRRLYREVADAGVPIGGQRAPSGAATR